jgi:predicted NBD/HSP70 family sugar kinase
MGTLWTEVQLLEDDRNLTQDGHKARSVIARFIAGRTRTSRSDIVKVTGLARSTVEQHLRVLLDHGLIEESDASSSDVRGRPAQTYRISADKGVVLVAAVSLSRTRLALTSLDKQIVRQADIDVDVSVGPSRMLDALAEAFTSMMADAGLTSDRALAMSVGLPGPVDLRRGYAVRPPRMPGWDSYSVCKHMADGFMCDIVVDNDVNLMALGEARALGNDGLPVLMVDIDSGIGGGLVSEDGLLLHGADGAATTIGHTRVPDHNDVICHCGGRGCLEAVASIDSMAARFGNARGKPATPADLLQALMDGDGGATSVVRDAALLIGDVVANLVNFYNPARVVLGGPVTESTEDMLAQIRSVVYQQAQPLATRNLSIVHSSLGDDAGLVGGMVNAIEQVLSPRGIQYQTRGSDSKLLPLGL